MYAIVKKVTRPPRISRLTVEPRSVIRKNPSSPLVEPRPAVAAAGLEVGVGFAMGSRVGPACRAGVEDRLRA